MLLETFKTLAARFQKPEASTNNESQSAPPGPSSTDEPSQVLTVPPASTLPVLETQSAVAALTVSSVAVPGEQPAPRHLNSLAQTLAVPDTTPASGFFANSHHNVINNPTMISVTNPFDSGGGAILQLLESKTIQGAEHDSSARYPPPKCHPETRQTLREEIHDWVLDPMRSWRMFYILGPAGVGKSAVAQSVADEVDCLGASCFISRPNHRDDPDGVIPTLAYQLAVKHAGYKKIISQKIGNDPTILTKTRRAQFRELLIEPFHKIMTQDPSIIQNPFLIIIDGLDECKSEVAQCEFIELISDHVRTFPMFPLLWLICSRPELHLKYTLSQADFRVICRREEMSVDDKEGRRDVLIYLRSEFRKIRSQQPDALDHNWPPEAHLLRIATAASGLFAFASTVTRFVGDAAIGDPSSQLRTCMKLLGRSNMPLGQNPYHTLDLLYRHILTSIPSTIRATTMRILGMSISYPDDGFAKSLGLTPATPSHSVRALANFLRIRKATFYHALKQLHSVLLVPSSSEALENPIGFYHASFGDFLRDPGRSGEFCLDKAAVHYDVAFTALRWHTDPADEIEEGDIWISPSEDPQKCLKNIKSRSLDVLWKACSHVEGKSSMSLYQELQKFDFNVLGSRVSYQCAFDQFLSWLHLQERDLSTRRLMNFTNIDEECNEVKVTDFVLGRKTETSFSPGDPDAFGISHLDLGNGNQCRHVHIYHSHGAYKLARVYGRRRHKVRVQGTTEIQPPTTRK